MLNKLFKDYTTYQKVVRWFNVNEYVSEIKGLSLIDYPINKVINIQVTDGKIWVIAIVDDKVSYFIIEDEVIEDGKLDKLINFKLIKNINKTEVLKKIDMKGMEQMKNLYNAVKNNNIEEVEEVTNEQKALQMIKNETVKDSVKYEVIEWVESMSEDYDNMEDIFNDLFTGGCESGMVTNLIYYKDTLAFYNKHEHEIKIFLEEYLEIEDVESWDGLQELSDIFPQLDDADTRHIEAEEEVREKAEEEAPELYGDDWDEMDEDEQMDAIQEYASNIIMYDNDPMELNNQDKNYLAWAIFEHEASLLYDEYLDVLNKLYMEEL